MKQYSIQFKEIDKSNRNWSDIHYNYIFLSLIVSLNSNTDRCRFRILGFTNESINKYEPYFPNWKLYYNSYLYSKNNTNVRKIDHKKRIKEITVKLTEF